MKQVLLAPNQLPTPSDHATSGRFPFLVSRKLDGNRLVVMGGQLLSRTMKLQPNKNLLSHLSSLVEWGRQKELVVDGELYCHGMEFSDLQSIVRAADKPIPHDVRFHVFDLVPLAKWGRDYKTPFDARYEALSVHWNDNRWAHTSLVTHCIAETPAQLEDMYSSALADGYEGLILRNPSGVYKHGRATVKENIIYKMKPFDTLDAVVIGAFPKLALKDGVTRKVNEMGRTARTHKAADHVEVDEIGGLTVRDEQGREFNIGWGKGWNHDQRAKVWDQHKRNNAIIGRWVEVRFMAVGEKDLPRMPQLVRFREPKE